MLIFEASFDLYDKDWRLVRESDSACEELHLLPRDPIPRLVHYFSAPPKIRSPDQGRG